MLEWQFNLVWGVEFLADSDIIYSPTESPFCLSGVKIRRKYWHNYLDRSAAADGSILCNGWKQLKMK